LKLRSRLLLLALEPLIWIGLLGILLSVWAYSLKEQMISERHAP